MCRGAHAVVCVFACVSTCVCVCVCESVCLCLCVCWLEDNVSELILSCHHVNPGDHTEIVSLDERCLYPLGYLLNSNNKYKSYFINTKKSFMSHLRITWKRNGPKSHRGVVGPWKRTQIIAVLYQVLYTNVLWNFYIIGAHWGAIR